MDHPNVSMHFRYGHGTRYTFSLLLEFPFYPRSVVYTVGVSQIKNQGMD